MLPRPVLWKAGTVFLGHSQTKAGDQAARHPPGRWPLWSLRDRTLAKETPPSRIGWTDDSKVGIRLTNAPRKMSSYEKQTLSVQDDGAHGDGESQTYLRVAEIVLSKAMTPLKAREIVDRGIEQGLFGDHVMGRTPGKSMQARLSIDILSRGPDSRFARTGKGRFTARSNL